MRTALEVDVLIAKEERVALCVLELGLVAVPAEVKPHHDLLRDLGSVMEKGGRAAHLRDGGLQAALDHLVQQSEEGHQVTLARAIGADEQIETLEAEVH